MSGRNIGLAVTSFSGVRVTGELTYVPAHYNAAGKLVNAKCEIPVAKNSLKGTRPDGSKGSTDYFKLTAWNKLADTMARSCPKGKALDVVCEPRSYMGKLHNSDGTLRLDAAGQPIMIPKMSFNIIMSPVFGEDSSEFIAKEIAEGLRPVNWDKKGHPDYDLWITICKNRKALIWDGQSAKFEYARVYIPNGVRIDFTKYGQQAAQAPVQQPVANAQSVATMVQNATQPVQQPVQTTQVVQPAAQPVQQVQQVQPAAQPVQQYVAPTAPAAAPGGNITQVI